MIMEKSTDVRREWSTVCDSVVHDKPVFIKRTHDRLWFSSIDLMKDILEKYVFTADQYSEPDGSITISLNEIDLVENGSNEKTARKKIGEAILEYAQEYYDNYSYYSSAPNRKSHIPYIFKALIIDDPEKIGDNILCRAGKN